MLILGLSCHYHDAAACLVRDGAVLAAAQEERFDRVKGSAGFPAHAIDACLREAGATLADVDEIAFYERPFLKLERVLIAHLRSWPRSFGTFLRTLPPWLEDRLVLPELLRRELGWKGPLAFLPHHASHAASAFLPSPFDEAAVITADGVGEWATTSIGLGRGGKVVLLDELRYPHSLGLLYTAVTTWLGFEALHGEGKVMALADHGEPGLLPRLREGVHLREDGSFALERAWFGMHEGARMVGPAFEAAFGPARTPDAPIEDRHRAVAASLQRLLEEAMLGLARRAHARTGLDRLCLAGGVALNVSANARLRDQGLFREIFVQPAAGDAGGALGAALQVQHLRDPAAPRWHMRRADLGPGFGVPRMRRALEAAGFEPAELDPASLCTRAAVLIDQGRVLGCFQGRMEFGPRALGQRSILADPRNPGMRAYLNAEVKHREPFRPYGVAVLEELAPEWFRDGRPSPFMLMVDHPISGRAERIPSALHVNGSSRLQTVSASDNGIFHGIVAAFHARTGVPMVINTSFNDRGEPIVCTPEDALRSFARMPLDALCMGPFLIEKAPATSGT